MIEIQSLMAQVNNLINKKNAEKENTEKMNRKFEIAMSCLERTLKN
jgi:hypothetical protein